MAIPHRAEPDPALEALRARVEAHLQDASASPVRVAQVLPLAGGACQDNFVVQVEPGEGWPLPGVTRLVLRSDAPRSLPGSLDRAAERAVIEAAVAGGVTTPPARWPARGLVRSEAEAYLLEWREGVAIGRKLVRDDALAAARAGLPAAWARELATLHALTPARAPQLVPVLGPPPADPCAAAVANLTRMVDGLRAPRPALVYALRWLGEQAQRASWPREVTLTHGDFRTGNFLVTPAGLSAVLDWEFAHWGAPAEDLAWLCVRDWRFGALERPVGGVGARAPFLAAYAAAGGRAPGADELRFWEVYGNARWAAGCVCQGERYLSGEQPDLELFAIARRAPEMEYEALRLIAEVAA